MIDTEVLKRKILDLAIKGKLVPQDPTDEPASELLKRIKSERDRLIDEGKIKGKKDDFSYIFKGEDNCYYEKIGKQIKNITDEIPFDIPNNWAWTRIKTISKVKNGFTPLRSNSTFWENGDMPWFTINDIELNGGDFIYKTKESITRWAYKDERVIKPNTTLICCTASIGEVAFAKVSLITNQQFNAIELFPYIDSINSLWIYIFALTLKPLLKRLMGATTFGFVSVSKVENILMPIPPLNEQKRIIQTYFQIQEKVKLVETNDKVLNKLKEVIKRKIITLGINGKLLDTDDNYYYEKMLSDVAKITMGQSIKSEEMDTIDTPNSLEFHQGKTYFTQKTISNSNIYTKYAKKTAEPNSILFSVRAPVGAINYCDRQIAIGRGLAAISPQKFLSLDYLYYLLFDSSKKLVESSTGTTFDAIKKEQLFSLKVKVPPYPIQEKIISIINKCLNTLLVM